METARYSALQIKLERLLDVAALINAERDLDKLLELILKTAVDLTEADAGSIYVREKERLFFRVALNRTLSRRDKTTLTTKFGRSVSIPLDEHSIAGFVAKNDVLLNIPDAYAIPDDRPYRHNRAFDEASDYECRSMLLSPLRDHRGAVVGVIQLINARYDSEKRKWEIFSDEDERLITSLSSLAGTAVTRSILINELYETYKLVMTRMALAVEQRESDPDTFVHIHRIADYSAAVARRMGLDEDFVRYIRDAAPMHDIGKQCIPDAILFKPGRLTPEEFEVVKKHTLYGSSLFAGMEEPIARFAYNITRHHHERYDGKGYPDGLAAEGIPLEARIVSVVDVFDALATNRVYKKAMPLEKCLAIINEGSGTQFDPKVVAAFMEVLDEILVIREHYEKEKASASL